MGIRKQPQVVAVKQGRGRKINKCYSEKRKTGVGEYYLEAREGSPC
jgi:hypothetical protein